MPHIAINTNFTHLETLDLVNFEKTFTINGFADFDIKLKTRLSKLQEYKDKITTQEKKIRENKSNIEFLESAIFYLERKHIKYNTIVYLFISLFFITKFSS